MKFWREEENGRRRGRKTKMKRRKLVEGVCVRREVRGE